MKTRILNILKHNEVYSFTSYCRRSAGLWNSVNFITETLRGAGFPAEQVEVEDNNSIDREVTRFKPDIVIIQALWVVPEKFDILRALHPKARWFIHLHSHIPFLAIEGIAIEWILKCAERGVGIIANSRPAYEALRCILSKEQLIYLPNVYLGTGRFTPFRDRETIDVGCFGAIRPLKNQLIQALAAIKFARQHEKRLRFHVNSTRMETGGEPVMKNLRALFDSTPEADLVEAKWTELDSFLDYVQTMDIGMQVSLSETWNHVCANYVEAGIPVVASKEVYWLSATSKAKDDSVRDIVAVMNAVWRSRMTIYLNQWLLNRRSMAAQRKWVRFARSDGRIT